jgi:hypothetical protein
MRKKMTKKFHKCDDSCKHIEKKPKVIKKIVKKPKVVKKEIKPEVVNVYKLAPKTNAIIEIINIVDEIDNENETNKVLEKTLITLRKLQQDIAN